MIILAVILVIDLRLPSDTDTGTAMDQYTAAQKLDDAGCWYDLSNSNVSIAKNGDNWVMTQAGCSGQCTINAFTGNIHIDTEPDCTNTQTPIDKTTAVQRLEDAGCWYHLSDSGVSIVHDGNNWVMQKEGCGGKCTINALTGNIKIDSNEMCTGTKFPIDRYEALQELDAAGCWYDLSEPTETINKQGNNWVITKQGCTGQCRINANTGVISIDSSPGCSGNPPIDRLTAKGKLENAGCWYDPNNPTVTLQMSGDWWTMTKQGCTGQCRINAWTGVIRIDSSSGCQTPPIDRATAIGRLITAGCYYHMDSPYETIDQVGDYWVMSKTNCTGTCRIQMYTGVIGIDPQEGCTQQPIDKNKAAQDMDAAGCWYKPYEQGVSIVQDGNFWVMEKENCGGKCKVQMYTEQVSMDSNPMCTGTEMDEQTAVEKLEAAGCWYSEGEEGVSVDKIGDDWVMSKKDCGGKCTINAMTAEIHIDSNPMCTGVIPPVSNGTILGGNGTAPPELNASD